MEQPVVRIAHKLFSISLVAWGIQQCIAGQIVAGRPPAWPSSLPGEFIVACIVGAWLIINGIAVLLNKKVDVLIPTAIFIVIYCVLRNLWVVLTEGDIGIHLTNFGKGITLTGGLLLVSVTSPRGDRAPRSTDNIVIRTSVYCIGLFLLVSGIQHFIYSDFVKFLVPSWIPFPMFWTYASGVALALSGLCLIIGIKRQQVAYLAGLMIFSWFIILHIPRALHDSNMNEWTAVFEALAFSCILVIIGKSTITTSVFRKH